MAQGSQEWLKVFRNDPYQENLNSLTLSDDFRIADMPVFGITTTVSTSSVTSPSARIPTPQPISYKDMHKELVLLSCIIVICCQLGFGLLHSGLSRSKNCLVASFVVFLNTLLVVLGHWGTGHTFATTEGSYFIGYYHYWFSESMPSSEYIVLLQSLCYVVTTINIIPGGMLERVTPGAHVTVSIMFAVIVHPVVIHSAWHSSGWLQSVQIHTEPVTYQDFAGSGTVHVFAGMSALVGSVLAGPRLGKFSKIKTQNFNSHLLGHSSPLYIIGGLLVILDFIILHILRAFSHPTVDGAAVVTLNTIIATTISALTSFILVQIIRFVVKYCCWDVCKVKWPVINLFINGALSGIAAVAAGCNVYYPWSSAVVGFVAGCAYVFWSFTMSAFAIDDPADVFATHAGGGFWGIFAVVIFGRNGIVFYPTTTNYKILAWNLAGVVAIAVWSALMTLVCLGPFRVVRRLCVSEEVERTGLDISLFGESAYPWYAWRNPHDDDGDESRIDEVPKRSTENVHHVPLDRRHSVGIYHF